MHSNSLPRANSPTISVITIALNVAKTIGATLQSVAEQQESLSQVEHIVVDGASKDNTLEIVRTYPHVRYISEPDRGIADAFNKGFHLAQGQYLLYLNADDVLNDATVLKDALAFINERHAPDWIVGNVRVRQVDGNVRPAQRSIPPSCWSLMFRQRICHQAVFLKRTVLAEAGGFDINLKTSMDYDLWARLCLAGYHLTYFDRVIAVYAAGGFSFRTAELGRQDKKLIRSRLRNTPIKRFAGSVYDRLKGQA